MTASGSFIVLDRRLELWRRSTGRERIASPFSAVAWIGNAGAHEVNELMVINVLDGVDFIDKALHAL